MEKLKWTTELQSKDTMFEEHITLTHEHGKPFFVIDVRRVMHLKRIMYCLHRNKSGFVGYFKKLSSAKKVAQLIHNG